MNKEYLALFAVIILLVVVLGVVLSQPKSDNLPLLIVTPTTTPTNSPSPISTPTLSPTATPTQSPTAAPTLDDNVFMVTPEQASIANIAFIGTNAIDVLLQNSGSTTVNITQAFVNGVGAKVTTTAGPLSVDKSGATTFHLTAPTALSAGNSYQIKLITAKGTQIQNSAVYNP